MAKGHITNSLLCATINVRGLNEPEKRKRLFYWLEDKSYDVIFLQETFCTNNFVNVFNRDWKGKTCHATTNSKHSRGVSILFSNKRNINIVNSKYLDNGRALLVNVDIDDEHFTMVCLYAPNELKQRTEFFTEMKQWIVQNNLNEDRLIIGGDLNCCESCLDKSTPLREQCSYLKEFKSYTNVKDTWRLFNPSIIQYTYKDPGNQSYGSRIDYILCSQSLSEKMLYSEIIHAPVPDHDAVVTSFSIDNEKRGSGYWKLNVSVLEESEYQDNIRKLITQTLEENIGIEKALIWELLKIRIKELSIRYCTLRNRRKNKRLDMLEFSIGKIKQYMKESEKELDKLKAQKEVLENEINIMLNSRAKGAQIRSKAKWIEEGEKSTAYFLRLEKHHQITNVIKGLRNNKGDIIHGSEGTLAIMKEFYENLYSSRNPDEEATEDYFNDIKPEHVLDESEQQVCEGSISAYECEEVLKKMKNNKSPGRDGIPVEFYKVFWHDLNEILVDSFNESFANGTLSPSQRTSVISLLFKKGDKYDIKNYRPISLTNIDYKIVASVLALRLKKVLPSIISTDQTGFMEGRFIGCNVRLVNDIIQYANENNKEGCLIMLDFEKAFDTLEWSFLQNSLIKFNFGTEFIRWVSVLYNKPNAIIKNNNHLSEGFNLTRGVRQGCPLSALLFTLAVEILAINLKQDTSIKGFLLPDESKIEKETKLSQYADDTILILSKARDTDKAIDLISKFGLISGLRLNLKKTVGVPLGRDRKDVSQLSKIIEWTTKPVKVLGIYVGGEDSECMKMNWDKRLLNLEKLLNTWKQRDLTLFGKITIIKTLALPSMIYCASIICVPQSVVKQIEKLLYKFIWKSKDRIKRNKLINNIEDGGMNMIDIVSQFESLKAIWVNRISQANSTHNWSRLPRFYLNKIGLKVITLFNFCSEKLHVLYEIPQFYREVIMAFSKAKVPNKIISRLDLLSQTIWGNHLLSIKKGKENIVLYFRNWIESGIIKLSDCKFIGHEIDMNFLYNKVQNKGNIFGDCTVLLKALRPYKKLLDENTSDNIHINTDDDQPSFTQVKKSKTFYKALVNRKVEKVSISKKWKEGIRDLKDSVIKLAFTNKVKRIWDKKLAEFNYKMLHNIVPCPENLKRWKKSDIEECDTCKETCDINHMLITCKLAKYSWELVSAALNIDMTIENIILGIDQNAHNNFIISIICFILYKYWLLSHKEGRNRNITGLKIFLDNEIKMKIILYKYMGKNTLVNNLTNILSFI